MLCPDCGYDNIDGVDVCEACGQPMWEMESGGKLEQSIAKHSVQVLVPKTPLTIESTVPVRDAIRKMFDEKIGCLLVEDQGNLVGIFTERDVLNKVAADLAGLDRPVTNFMTASPETITSQDSIAYALHAMDSGGYRHLPVVDNSGKPTGIISVRDILRFLCVRFAEIRSRVG